MVLWLEFHPWRNEHLLTLTNVGFAQAGNYSVVITNAYGSATGGPAALTVVDTTPPTIISVRLQPHPVGRHQLHRHLARPDRRSRRQGRLRPGHRDPEPTARHAAWLGGDQYDP